MGGAASGESIQYSVPVESEAPPGRSQIFRASEKPVLDSYECKTLAQAFQISRERNPNQPFIGTRERLPDNTLGDYVWKTYNEIADLVSCLAVELSILN